MKSMLNSAHTKSKNKKVQKIDFNNIWRHVRHGSSSLVTPQVVFKGNELYSNTIFVLLYSFNSILSNMNNEMKKWLFWLLLVLINNKKSLTLYCFIRSKDLIYYFTSSNITI
jgi:hypothetical protein